MTPVSQSSDAARRARRVSQQQAQPRPRVVTQRLPVSKVGWDRKFRAVLIVVILLVGWIAFKAAWSMYQADQQANHEAALVQSLKAQNRALQARKTALNQRATIMSDARQLGMVQNGERGYVMTPNSQ